VSEIRLVRGEPSEESFHDVLFQALPGQKTFGAIRGRFAGAGKNWTVTVTGTDPLWKERTWTRTEGETFTILPALPGNHELRFSDLCCSIVLPVTVLPGETTDLGTIAHSKRGGGAVRGRIINHAGRPAAGLTVTLWEDANAQDGRRASAVTDLDGRFEISGVDEAFRNPRMEIYTKEGGLPLQRRPVRIGELDLLLRLPEPDSKEENR